MPKLIALLLCTVCASVSFAQNVDISASAGTLTASYTTLKSAFDNINNGTHKGIITIAVKANTVETASAALIASAGSANYSTITIQPSGGGARTISGSLAAPLIDLNGADNVTLDGLNTGGNSLTISNTNTTATSSTIRFIADATNNTIKNCTISGSETGAALGTIFFSTGTATGNDGNSIASNTITSAGVNLPFNAIYSAGTSAVFDNSGISILNNNIQDYYNPIASSNGIFVASYNSAWTITGNKFYQTATRTATASAVSPFNVHRAINIITATGVGYTVSNNIIGYANASGTGVTNYGGAFANRFIGIEMNVGTATVSSVQGNIINGISLSTTSGLATAPGIFTGISILAGNVNIGTTSGNTIGATTGTGSIIVTSTTSGAYIAGIYATSTSTVSIQNNTVGSISIDGTALIGYTFHGINTAGAAGNFTVTSNTIGSATTANSITVGTNGTTTTGVCTFNGITNASTGTTSVTNNTIQNCSVYGAAASAFNGIANSGSTGTLNITGNGVRIGTNTGTGAFTAISNAAAPATVNINSNIIRSHTRTAASGAFTGISNTGAATSAINFNSNQLGNINGGMLTLTNVSSGAITGISNSGGSATCALTIQSNDIRGIVHSVAGTSAHTYIINSAATLSQNISTNTFTNLDVNTTGAIIFISNNVVVSATGTQNVDGNSIVGSFTRTSSAAIGALTLFTSLASSVSGAVISNSNNNFSNIMISGTATIAGWINTDAGAGTKTIQGNTFSNWTGGTGVITGMNVSISGAGNKITGNNINTINGGGNITAITTGAGNDNIYSNTINTISSTGTLATVVTGIAVTAGTTKNIYQNIITGLHANFSNLSGNIQNSLAVNGVWVSGGTTVYVNRNTIYGFTADAINAGTINGITVSGGATVTLSRNKIYDLSSNSTAINSGGISGLFVYSVTGSVTNIINNTIGDIRTPLSGNSDSYRGISINTSTVSDINVYFNTIYLNSTSTGANFGSTGIYHAFSSNPLVGKLDLRNNIITNLSAPTGSGITALFRQYGTPLDNYAATSNNNLYYAGPAGPKRVIFLIDPSSSDQALSTFKTRLGNREGQSFAEDVTVNFLSLDGSSPYFLHIDSTICTRLESGGINISGITDDYDGQVRAGNPGYTGTGSAPDIGADEFEGNAIPTAVLSGSTTICNGSSVTLSLAVIGNGTISGKLSDSTYFSGTAPNITLSVSPSSTTTYTIATLNNGVCTAITSDKSGSAVVTVAARPTAVLSGTQTICNGSSAILSLAATGTGPISGTLSNGTAFSGTAPTITVSVIPSSNTVYTIATLTNGSCTSIAADKTGSATVTLNPRPAVAISGTQTICSGSSAALSLAVTGLGTISGTLSNGSNFSGSAPTITVSVSPITTTTYTVASLTNGTCTSIAADRTGSAVVTVTSPPYATISFTGSPYCQSGGTATVTITGTTGGTFTSTPGLSINSVSGAIALGSNLNGTYIVTYTVAVPGGCSQYQNTASVTIVAPGTWSGAVNTDWNNNDNWLCGAIPTCSTNVTIPGSVSNYPFITLITASANDINIQNGGAVTISGGTLQIAGTITNSGTFNAASGAVELIGTSAQTIPANAFVNNAVYDLVINNNSPGGIILGGALDIYGSITYSGTGKKFNTNDLLTLKSTASNTAWVGDMTGNIISGDVTVERYLSSRKAWRFLSVPTNTSQTIRQTWQEGCGSNLNCVSNYGTQITGAGGTAAGFDLYTATPSLKTYNPVANTFVGVSGTSINIKSTEGYMLFVRGDRGATTFNAPPTSTVLRTKGNLFTGDQAAISIGSSLFGSIGNPFAASIDMRNISRTGIKNFFYLWDPNLSGYYGYGAYQTFSYNGLDYVVTPGGGSYGPGGSVYNFIPSGQAFFVQATATGGSITFKEAAKTTGSLLVASPIRAPGQQLRTNLYGINADGSTYVADGTLINYDDAYTNAVDDMDGIKSANTNENLAIKSAAALLVIERRHSIDQQDTVQFNLGGVRVQAYRFEFIANRLDEPGMTAYFEDSYLKTKTPLDLNGTTIVDFTIANIPGSYASNRFRIVFTPATLLPLNITSVKAHRLNKNIQVEWSAENEANVLRYEVEQSEDGSQFKKAQAVVAKNTTISAYAWTDVNALAGFNYYRIKIIDANGKITYSKIVKVFMNSSEQMITVFPNPVKSGIINLQFVNQAEGTYGIRLMNKSGQVMTSREINHGAAASIETIPFDKYIPYGIYQLEITRPDKTKSNINVIY